MINKIKELEAKAGQLEPNIDERKEIRNKVVNYAENFLNNIYDINAYNFESEKGKDLHNYPINNSTLSIDKALELIEKNVDYPGLNPASGGHLGYIPGGGIYVSALGDYLADVTNRYAGIFYASPGAVRMENMLVQWSAEILGYPSTSAGHLASGGSIANLTAIVTARDAKKITSDKIPTSVIYMTSQVHHCIDKAIRIAGLKECVLRKVPMDSNSKMNVNELEKMLESDSAAGLNPFLVIASAGTTDTGAIDPFESIADLATKFNLWFHIDAAYGGYFILTDEGKQKLKGIEKSDSIVLDPHKGLFMPYGTGIVVIKQATAVMESFHYLANYMQDIVSSRDEVSPADISPELTKHFRGLRMWLPLKIHGLEPFKACLEEKLMLSKYFYSELAKFGFEMGPEPELSVVTYRWVPKNYDANLFNKRLAEEVQQDGKVFISTTMLGDIYTLRFACLSFRTHLETVDYLINILKRKVKELEN